MSNIEEDIGVIVCLLESIKELHECNKKVSGARIVKHIRKQAEDAAKEITAELTRRFPKGSVWVDECFGFMLVTNLYQSHGKWTIEFWGNSEDFNADYYAQNMRPATDADFVEAYELYQTSGGAEEDSILYEAFKNYKKTTGSKLQLNFEKPKRD